MNLKARGSVLPIILVLLMLLSFSLLIWQHLAMFNKTIQSMEQ